MLTVTQIAFERKRLRKKKKKKKSRDIVNIMLPWQANANTTLPVLCLSSSSFTS